MKQILHNIFGGLVAICCGVILAYGVASFWHMVRPHILAEWQQVNVPTTDSDTKDSASISQNINTVRYTAAEEEDLINATAKILPKGSDKRITSHSFLVKDLSNNTVVAEYNQEAALPIASISKLLTAIVARKLIDPETRISITRDVMATYGNTASFRVGETFTAQDLLYPLLMVSSNDAAEAFAQSYGRKKFIKAMNDFTQSIGAYRTYFKDPSGLSGENVSSANDLAIILNWILVNDPEIIGITQLKSKTMRSHTWTNPTHFLSWSYYAGGKNGYTTEANRTAAQLFKLGKNNDTYAVIILGSQVRDADMLALIKKIEVVAKK